MPLLPAPRPDELRGDFLRRRARFGLALLVVMLLAAWPLFGGLDRLWPSVAAMEGTPFLAAATVLGAALAGTPLLALVGLLMAVWYGVESVYQPRRRASPLADKLIVAFGLLVWFGPALGLVVAAVRAVATGSIHFTRPPRDYVLATDPIAFWQGVGFWLIVATALGYLGWRYWRGKLGATPID
jgi:hypothetical protein